MRHTSIRASAVATCGCGRAYGVYTERDERRDTVGKHWPRPGVDFFHPLFLARSRDGRFSFIPFARAFTYTGRLLTTSSRKLRLSKEASAGAGAGAARLFAFYISILWTYFVAVLYLL